MSPAERRVQLARAEAVLAAEEKQRMAGTTLDESLREAATMYVLTVAELSRRSASPEELSARLLADPPVDLSALWRARHDVRSR